MALAYGIFAMILLATPGASGDFFTDYVVPVSYTHLNQVVLVEGDLAARGSTRIPMQPALWLLIDRMTVETQKRYRD